MPLTFRQRKRTPRLQEIAMVWRMLSTVIPMDTPPQHGWRESLKGVPNYRFKSSTNEKEWSVDIYLGGYYVVTTGDRFPEPCKTIPSLVGYLCRMLRIKPKLRRQGTD